MEEARAWFEEGTRTLEGAASVALWQVGYDMRPGDHRAWVEHVLNNFHEQAWAVLEARQGDATAVRYLFKRALGVNPKSRFVASVRFRCLFGVCPTAPGVNPGTSFVLSCASKVCSPCLGHVGAKAAQP